MESSKRTDSRPTHLPRNKSEFTALVHGVLANWDLFEPDNHCLQVFRTKLSDGWAAQYCSKEGGDEPFSLQMMTSSSPPNYLAVQWVPETETLFLLFIQVHKRYRGQGHGDALYKLVLDLGRRLGAKEVRQTPSGGYDDEDRSEYLARRGWTWDGKEMTYSLKARTAQ